MRWSGSDWEPLAPTDDVLAGLPLSLRVDLSSECDEVWFRYFKDGAWHGLSASDREGGVSNSTTISSDGKVWATEASVCVSWSEAEEEYGNGMTNELMRCHEW